MPATSLRVPLYGLVSPKTAIAVNLAPPLTSTERAIVISTTPDQVRWQVMNAQSVVISNESELPLMWTMVFIPLGDVLPPFETWKPLLMEIWAKIRAARAGAVVPPTAMPSTSASKEK